MPKFILSVVATIGATLFAHAQPTCAPIQWQRSLGGAEMDRPVAGPSLPRGGFLIGAISSSTNGTKLSPNYGGLDFWLVRLSDSGTPLWDKSYGGINHEELAVVRQTVDGGFILGGTSYSDVGGVKTSPLFGQADYWVVRVDATGQILWDKSFGGTGYDELRDLQATADGGFLLAGFSASPSDGNKTA